MARCCTLLLTITALFCVSGCAWMPGIKIKLADTGKSSSPTPPPNPFAAAGDPLVHLVAHTEPVEEDTPQSFAQPIRKLPPVKVDFGGHIVQTPPDSPDVEWLPAANDPDPSSLELAPTGTLDSDLLVVEVLARNPSVEAMIATWRAAAARYPQAIALDDPFIDYAAGPDSWGDTDVQTAYALGGGQRIPWPGKRRLRGRVANWEASAAASDIDDTRRLLAAAARFAFVDYFTATRDLVLNADNLREVNDFRDTATAKLRASTASQQDVLQSDVELALLAQRQHRLEREVIVATARINTLLHRNVDHPLPPPPEELSLSSEVPTAADWQTMAIAARPDLAAIAAEIEAARAEVALACKDFYPDVDLYYNYNGFMPQEDLREMIGVRANVPIYRGKRWAAVREARNELLSLRAQYERLVDEVANDVAAAYARLDESRKTVELYREQILPAATKNVDSARAAYTSGSLDFLRLIDAERQLIALREQHVEAIGDYHRALAELQQAAGGEIAVAGP